MIDVTWTQCALIALAVIVGFSWLAWLGYRGDYPKKSPKCEECKYYKVFSLFYTCERDWPDELRNHKVERSPGWLMARLTGRCGKEGRYFEHV